MCVLTSWVGVATLTMDFALIGVAILSTQSPIQLVSLKYFIFTENNMNFFAIIFNSWNSQTIV